MMIEVSFDEHRKLVVARICGFLTTADVWQFNDDKENAVVAMGLSSGEFTLLVNATDSVIQSQEVVAAFTNAVLRTRYHSRRLAVVRLDNLTRLQTRRILSVRDDAAMFGSVEEAEAWLLESDVDNQVASFA